jgi:hypothetical protein
MEHGRALVSGGVCHAVAQPGHVQSRASQQQVRRSRCNQAVSWGFRSLYVVASRRGDLSFFIE